MCVCVYVCVHVCVHVCVCVCVRTNGCGNTEVSVCYTMSVTGMTLDSSHSLH